MERPRGYFVRFRPWSAHYERIQRPGGEGRLSGAPAESYPGKRRRAGGVHSADEGG